MSPKNDPRLSKAERTAQAREQAKTIRDAQLKKEKRRGWLIRGGVLAAAVAIVVIIALIVIQTNKANEPVASTGPGAGEHERLRRHHPRRRTALSSSRPPPRPPWTSTSWARLPPRRWRRPLTWKRLASRPSATGEPIQTVVYFDFMCPFCGNFEKQYGAQLKSLASEKKITVEYRALGFLDRFSSGTNYSSRAGAAAACVADKSPDKYQAFLDILFVNQPAENSKGLDNATLKKYATEVGAADIGSCVDDKTFRPYMANTTGAGHCPRRHRHAHRVHGRRAVAVT